MQHLPFGGLVSFARSPVVELAADWQAEVGMLGIPFDIALGYRPGARFAPRAIREASLRYSLSQEGFYDYRSNRYRLAGLKMVDTGDVVLPSLEPDLARERITEAAKTLKSKTRLPVFLGGDHSVTYPVLKAFSDVPDLHIVQLDAHLDFSHSRNDTLYSNSSPFRRACEELPNLVHITTVGLRGLRCDPEAVQAAQARGHSLVHAEDLGSLVLPEGKNVYLSFDVDVLDPIVLPATSSPEVSGLSYAEAMGIIRQTALRNTIVGLDVVELTPQLDPSQNSNLLIARLIMETLCEVLS